MQAVILAGGKGTRLKPFTINIPKPLVPLDDMPMLEIILRQLKYYGITEIILAVNHLAELIKAFFGDGKKLGINIRYSVEEDFLGTAGPLGLIENLGDDFIVMNGDILTTLNFDNFIQYHKNYQNDVTIASYQKNLKIDLGVLNISENDAFLDYNEKPEYNFWVSMGLYCLNKKTLEFIKKGEYLDMPEFMLLLKKNNKKIKCYRDNFFWLDMGRAEDYEQVTDVFIKNKKVFLHYE